MPQGITSQDLHDYVDGRLDDANRARVAGYLAAHPEAAAEVEGYRAQVAAMHALYDGTLDEPVPAAMRSVLRRHRIAAHRRQVAAALAALLFIGVAGAGGWWLRGIADDDDPALSRFVAEAEQTYRLYGASVAASDAAVQPAVALEPLVSRRLGVPVRLPPLEKVGFTLVALRFVPTGHGDAATLVYRDAQGRSAALFVARLAASDAAPRLADGGSLATLYRVHDGVGYALTANVGGLDERLKAALGGA